MSEMIDLHSANMIFHSRRDHLRTQIASKLFAAGVSPQTGELTVLPQTHSWRGGLSAPPQNPTPLTALRASSFSSLGLATEDSVEST